jgi:two-component system alkaline phosphatase synthesis response regulator PhoP
LSDRGPRGSTASKTTILVIGEKDDVRSLIRLHLEQQGYDAREAPLGEMALRDAELDPPALIVLQVTRPRPDGIDVCRRVRTSPIITTVPIIMLSARADELDPVLALEIGADDYMTEPFSPRELVARVRAVLRRSAPDAPPAPLGSFERGRLRIDFDTYEVYVEGRPATLSLREFALLRFFVQHPHRVYDRPQLLTLVWGEETYVEPRTVDVHVRRLRQAIERNDAVPEFILTVRGVGYMCNPDALER